MMNVYVTSHAKSSVRVTLLFVFLLASAHVRAGMNEAHADTLIIGGKLVLVEREVDYAEADSSVTPEAAPKEERKAKKRRPFGSRRLGFEVAPGLALQRPDLSTAGARVLNEYLGTPSYVSGQFSLTLKGSIQLGRSDFFLEGGIGVSYLSTNNRSFQTENLSDSLYSLYSNGAGELFQVTRFRYPIGAEFDTLAMQLSSSPHRSSWLKLPLQLVQERDLNRSLTLRWGIGMTVMGRMRETTETTYLISRENATDQHLELPASSLSSPQWQFLPSASLGARLSLDRNWWLSSELRYEGLFRGIRLDDEVLRTRGHFLAVGVGLIYLFD